MGGESRLPWLGKRGMIIGCAVTCYGAALVIGAAAARLPVLRTATGVPAAPAKAKADSGPSLPGTPRAAPPIDDTRKSVTAPSTRQAAVSDNPRWEQDLFFLAQRQRQSGDVKGAEKTYRRLLRQGSRRDEAARKLGEIYALTGAYRQAEEMYRESARILKERQH